jgi:hypothetical protein
MQKWEYLVQIQTRGYTGYGGLPSAVGGGEPTRWQGLLSLEALGYDGWELVAGVPISSSHNNSGFTTDLYYYFKRPKT